VAGLDLMCLRMSQPLIFGSINVQHYAVGYGFLDARYGRRAVVHLGDVHAFELEVDRYYFRNVALVFDDEDPGFLASGLLISQLGYRHISAKSFSHSAPDWG